MKQTLMQSKKSTWHGLKNVEVVGSSISNQSCLPFRMNHHQMNEESAKIRLCNETVSNFAHL